MDDGIATGSSVDAAVMSIKMRDPKEVVIAVPVAPPDTVESLRAAGNRVVCLETPGMFFAIGEFYQKFDQVEESEVKHILAENWRQRH